MDVQMPDGTLIQGVPDNVTKSQLLAKYGKLQAPHDTPPPAVEIPVDPVKRATNLVHAAIEGTIPFADEIIAGVQKPVLEGLELVSGGKYPAPTFDELRRKISDPAEQAYRDNPKLALAAGIAGSLATGGAVGATKTGKAIADSLGRGGLAARSAKGLGAGAATGASFGAGEGDAGTERFQNSVVGGIGGGIIGGAAPSILAGGSKLIRLPGELAVEKELAKRGLTKPAQTISGIDADSSLIAAVEPVQARYKAGKRLESSLYESAKEAGKDTNVSSDAVNGLTSKIEAKLNEEGRSLNDDDLKILNNQVAKLSKYESPPVGSGDIPNQAMDKGAPLSEIIAIRRGISGIAGKATDGSLRNAAGKALSEFDSHMDENLSKAVLSGDEKAIEKYQKAVNFASKQRRDFGTNKRAGQKSTFENVITKNDVDNVQLIDAFGTTSRGTQQTSQFVTRLLDNAGAKRENVRQNLAKGYLYRAIRRASHNLEGGEEIVDPTRLRTELGRLVDESRSTGGLGKDIRDRVYTPEQIKAMIALKDNLRDPRNFLGVIKQMGLKIPLADKILASPQITAGRTTRKEVERFLTDMSGYVAKDLRGAPFNYGTLIAPEANKIGNAPLHLTVHPNSPKGY